jgi:hypothetical protein
VAHQYKIPASNLAYLESKIAELARKAARRALRGALADETPIGLTVLDTVVEEQPAHPLTGKRPPAKVYKIVEVTGKAPCIAGWTFVATLQHEGEGTIVRTVPTADVADGELAAYRSAPPACDYCQTDRRRGDTFVLRSDDGLLKQVGRSCLGAFLGGLSPDGAASRAEWLAAADDLCGAAGEDGWAGGRSVETATLESYLAFVAAAIRQDGWMSRTAARDTNRQATADTALTCGLWPSPMLPAAQRLYATDEDITLATGAIAYATANLSPVSDYEHNLDVVLRAGVITHRTAGIAASLIPWYQRALGRELERRRQAQLGAASQHVGVVGKRESFGVCVLERVFSIETQYGVLHIHKFADAQGNILVWKTGSAKLESGRQYTVKGTVKAHDEYKGTKQTTLTRAAVEEKGA